MQLEQLLQNKYRFGLLIQEQISIKCRISNLLNRNHLFFDGKNYRHTVWGGLYALRMFVSGTLYKHAPNKL